MKTSIPIRLALLLSAITLPCQSLRAETFNLNLGAVIKDGIHKALQGDRPDAGNPAAGYPAPGKYDGSDASFERTIVVQADGRFELEVLQKGNTLPRHAGSGAGKLSSTDGKQWTYREDRCSLTVVPQTSALQLKTERCAGAFGDVPFDGLYRAGAKQAQAAARDKRLAAQLNCQRLNFGENGIASLLGKATRLPENTVWDQELPLPDGYAFGGLPIRSVKLSETDGGFLALFVDGDAAAIQAAIRKARVKGDYSVAMLRKIGEAGGYAFPGKRPGQPYVHCQSKQTLNGEY
ncbi:hypothetical protein [Chromobacterium violaceum]|uniref:C-type lysozyme inhibitor domain-containing protein n=1 Tax=Chromobacterium violaceum TaxID=536 RepID=A0AAX2MAF9_CHRVL|nr:hypothetical protein [Chromobacterium violaceum]OLZ76562.1 hypothetical protein BS642_15985 [Chromobacterium violaceum]STB64528.1 Uncharacterised protein [Chromobacterium violaceum]SUX33452.1 Uncharacterised protein [Chromobacterium violaceum]